ncbi:hypothetical protein AWM75_01490 [Aerococcus urinaehominis]|uniref:Uncharacterized protein n=1 Tax=Aerococcus urinaehominis TaxID=128944 RepID=A0A0X8FK12_9LACT|nr:mechanosensitive ion channel domain-containing protein [Aerococcus urinaehominis]AMB98748.1 hypothetical protein AWM75_01490 [Aerococcus urinaehominis]SDM14257.1 Small-conductance mechanosensitive channel [Aerococcus urinaehominis]
MFQEIIDNMGEGVSNPEEFGRRLLASLGTIALAYLASKLVGLLARKLTSNDDREIMILRLSRLFITLPAIVLLIYIWFQGVGSAAIFIILMVATITLALKDMIVDIVAYFYTIFRHPFRIGDVIEIAGQRGQVVDFDFLQFNLAEMGGLVENIRPTGRYISLPNRFIFEKVLTNYSHDHDFVVVETSILIAFDADRDVALGAAEQVAADHHQAFLDQHDEEELEEFTRFIEGFQNEQATFSRIMMDDNGFRIFVQFCSAYYQIAGRTSEIECQLYDAMVAKGITLPVPLHLPKTD